MMDRVTRDFQSDRALHEAAYVFGYDRTDLVSVNIKVTGKVVTEDGEFLNIELGEFKGEPTEFSTGSVGFKVTGKMLDITPTSYHKRIPTRLQFGANIVFIASKPQPQGEY